MWNKVIVCAKKHWPACLLVLVAMAVLNKACQEQTNEN